MVSQSSNELFSQVVDLMRRYPLEEDSELVCRLINMGIESSHAKRLIEFLPIVYGRLLLAEAGARFSDSFNRVLPDGSISSEQPFTSEPIWNAAVSFARREVARRISANDLLSVAGRSPEFEAANRLLQSGNRLEGIAFTPPILEG
jgi:hypothetical protein